MISLAIIAPVPTAKESYSLNFGSNFKFGSNFRFLCAILLFCQQLLKHVVTLHIIYTFDSWAQAFVTAHLPIYPVFRYDLKPWHPYLNLSPYLIALPKL